MKTYKQIPEDAEYREMYDSYRRTVDNLNDTDFLYETMMSNGQVFFKDDEVYGFVNGQPALRNRNISISRNDIDNFRITNFILFTRATNDLITLNINCNLADYRDNKVHYLYVVLDHNGTYEVWDDMFQSDENKILFARFLVSDRGDTRQFYMMLPFAGSADYIKGTQFYQVTDGLRVKVVNPNTKQLTVSRAKIRFSAINFDDKSSPDCITIDHEGNAVPIRYVYWDSEDNIPRVDWEGPAGNTLDFDTIMDYTNGRTSRVADGNFSIQKFYYDVYEHCIIAMYGNASFATREEAIYAIDSVMSYPIPDGVEYLIPIACIVMKNTEDPIDETNFRIVNLDYNEQEVLDSDTFTRQQAAEAVEKARAALAATEELSGDLNTHVGNLNNPHKVKLNQLYKSTGEAGAIDDSFAEEGLSVTALINRTITRADDRYLKLAGGTVTGNVTLKQTLAVEGKTTLADVDTGTIKLLNNKNITFAGDSDIGSSTKPAKYLYATNVSVSSTAYMNAISSSGNITPTATLQYDIGGANNRWNNGYFGTLNATKVVGGSGSTFSSGLSVSGTLSASNISASGTVSVSNGYLKVGGYSLVLGANSTTYYIPTTTGYGIW